MKTPTNSSTTKAQLNKVNRRILATSISALLGATLLGLAPTAKAQQFWDGAGVPADGQIDGGAGTPDRHLAEAGKDAQDIDALEIEPALLRITQPRF